MDGSEAGKLKEAMLFSSCHTNGSTSVPVCFSSNLSQTVKVSQSLTIFKI